MGVSDYIPKPFSPQEITDAVRQAIARVPETSVTDAVDRLAEGIKGSLPGPAAIEHRSPQAVAEMVARDVGVRKARAPVLSTSVVG